MEPYIYLSIYMKKEKEKERRISKYRKSSKESYVLGQKQNLQLFGVIPFVQLQNDT